MTRSSRRARGRLLTWGTSAVITLCGATAGCGVLNPDADEFTIRIDSVTGPTTIAPTDRLTQLLYGPVGPDGCSSFSSLRIEATTTGADVTAIGVRKRGTCIQVPVYLTGLPLTFSPPLRDPFVLRVFGPDGSTITRVIRIQ